MNAWKNTRGFTLVEVIVSMAILSLVVLMILSYFDYNLNAFRKGNEALDEQSNLRLTSFHLTDEFRNIGYVDLLETAPDSSTVAATTDDFLYLNADGIASRVDASSDVGLSTSPMQDMSFSLRKSGEKYFLGITLSGEHDTFSTEVLLNNIITDKPVQMDNSDIGSATVFTAIRYNFNHPPSD